MDIRGHQDAYESLRLEMETLEQEQMRTIGFNGKNRVISSRWIYQGTMNVTLVRVAEIFRPAIMDNAAARIRCHNYPSGDPEPSPDVLDHLVIGKGKFVGPKERGLAFRSPIPPSELHITHGCYQRVKDFDELPAQK